MRSDDLQRQADDADPVLKRLAGGESRLIIAAAILSTASMSAFAQIGQNPSPQNPGQKGQNHVGALRYFQRWLWVASVMASTRWTILCHSSTT